MAKLKSKPIDEKDLTAYLGSYSDFSFELAVLRLLRTGGLECQHGGLYVDQVTGKTRQFDIRAIAAHDLYHVRLAVECKNIRENFPILLSSVPREEKESYHEIILLRDHKRSAHDFSPPPPNRIRAARVRIHDGYSLYKSGTPVGKDTAQVGRATDDTFVGNDSELHEKWGQCLSSAVDLASDSYWDGEKDHEHRTHFAMVIPWVIVPNDRLWSVNYDSEGCLVGGPQQIDRASCFIEKHYRVGSVMASTDLTLSHMEIATEKGLQSFVEEYLSTKQGAARLFSNEGIAEARERARGH
jgi:hypothetical protein